MTKLKRQLRIRISEHQFNILTKKMVKNKMSLSQIMRQLIEESTIFNDSDNKSKKK